MDEGFVVAAMRVGWLTLTFLMLISRVLFQSAGAARMRAFLDSWQTRPVRRWWGVVCLAFAAFLGVAAVATGVDGLDLVLLVALVVLLAADGLVNVLPSGFRRFKDSVQEAWVSRHRDTARAGDRDLFTAGNVALGIAAAAASAVVIAYAPIAAGTLAVAAALAAALTGVLLVPGLRREP